MKDQSDSREQLSVVGYFAFYLSFCLLNEWMECINTYKCKYIIKIVISKVGRIANDACL